MNERTRRREKEGDGDGDGNRKSMHQPVAYDALSGILYTSACARARAHTLSTNDVFAAYRAGG